MAEEEKIKNIALASYLMTGTSGPGQVDKMPWRGKKSRNRKLDFTDHDFYHETVEECRFFYRYEPLAHTVVNRIVDLAINDLVIIPAETATLTEKAIFKAVKTDFLPFLQKVAMEYLVTGIAVPEITLVRLNKNQLRAKDIPRVDSLLYPEELDIRDAASLIIRKPMIGSGESIFLILPEELINFVTTGGEYEDGTKDIELYRELVKRYPQIVEMAKNLEDKLLLDNPLVVKGRTLADSPYPVPYLYTAIESMRHKRNLRNMDYSIASRVISAILHVTVGTDEFPLTEDQEDHLAHIEQQMKWRQSLGADEIERVFALFTNHTVAMQWVMPDIEALIDQTKYDSINEDILIALGFPRILVTGETQRSFTSDPQMATLSPTQTMNRIRDAILPIVKHTFLEMMSRNNVISSTPEVRFKPMNLLSLSEFYDGIIELYKNGNLSRESYSEAFGYDFRTEFERIKKEQEFIKTNKLPEFAPVPFSAKPGEETKKPVSKPVSKPGGTK